MTADYGVQKGGFKSPYTLLMDCGKVYDKGPGSVHELMVTYKAETERTDDHQLVAPEKWRKEGYVRPGQPGFRGPYDPAPPPRRGADVWWGDAPRSTPQQDRQRRKRR